METQQRHVLSTALAALPLVLASYGFSASPTAAGQPQQSKAVSGASKDESIPDSVRRRAEEQKIDIATVKKVGEIWASCGKDSQGREYCIEISPSNVAVSYEKPRVFVEAISGLRMGASLQFFQYGGKTSTFNLEGFGATTTSITLPENQGKLDRQADGSFTFTPQKGREYRVSSVGTDSVQIIDQLPKVQREAQEVVRTKDFASVNRYIESNPKDEFVVVITAPAVCPPCRTLDAQIEKMIKGAEAGAPLRLKRRVIIVEYSDFEGPKVEATGPALTLPTVMLFKPQEKIETPEIFGLRNESDRKPILGGLRDRVRGLVPSHIIRGVPGPKLFSELFERQ
jgi:hypothetical protein